MLDRFSNLTPVTIMVDVVPKPFKVWQSHICSVSVYFTTAFTSDFRESHDASIHLSDVTTSTFTPFLEWLYSRKLLDANCNVTAAEWPLQKLLDLYIFADKYAVLQLKQDVLARSSTN